TAQTSSGSPISRSGSASGRSSSPSPCCSRTRRNGAGCGAHSTGRAPGSGPSPPPRTGGCWTRTTGRCSPSAPPGASSASIWPRSCPTAPSTSTTPCTSPRPGPSWPPGTSRRFSRVAGLDSSPERQTDGAPPRGRRPPRVACWREVVCIDSLPMRRLKVGVLANEFFDLSLGRMGGFGWAARQTARLFDDPALGIEVVYLTGELRAPPGVPETVVHGARLIFRQSALADVRRARAERLDLLLAIDHRPNHRRLCWALPQPPMVVWVRDPRPPDDVAKVHTLRIPGANGARPKGTFQPDCSSLGTIVRASRWLGRRVLFASPAPHLRDKLTQMIGTEVDDFAFLPNPLDLAPGPLRKSERPRVVFLGRLDPYKRPWLFAALASRFPHVEFLFAGKA